LLAVAVFATVVGRHKHIDAAQLLDKRPVMQELKPASSLHVAGEDELVLPALDEYDRLRLFSSTKPPPSKVPQGFQKTEKLVSPKSSAPGAPPVKMRSISRMRCSIPTPIPSSDLR